MIDINLIRENPELVKENIKKKFQDNKLSLVDKVKELDKEWRELKQKADNLRHQRNKVSEEINQAKKQGKNAKDMIKKAKQIPEKIEKIEGEIEKLKKEVHRILSEIPQIMDKSVPIGKDSSENVVIKKVGITKKFNYPIKNHVELLEGLGIVDFDASAKTSGKGFYYHKNKLGILNQALIKFTIDFMLKKGYLYIEPPLMVKKEVCEAAEDFEAFKTKLYKIEGENLYLIPTAEHAILGMFAGKTIPENKLPLKLFGYSMCFRKEIGSHGINEKGLWRTHQFNKIEQFIFCKPEDSEKYYDELQKNAEEIYQALKIPYRIFECCSGDLSNWKVKSSDLEAYRPTTKEYGEVGSLSNCGDYQARDLNIKGINKKGERLVLHTLNNTALATSRAIVALIENNQQKDGSIKIPAVLWKYAGFKEIKPKEK
ncbi:MAG: serine--tRNA ligase [Nanoarchaeota archaeon]|nr:serine--tRNA ligase [Nanoarchaeota archaeon]